MEALSRQEYPAMLASLQPAQAVSTLSERIKRIGRVNVEIADWLQERRKVEDAYVLGLKKLAHKQPPDSHSELGIFTTPWQKIIAATESTAESHQTFAMSIERDVELPLRTFSAKNREMQAMGTIHGNLVAMQKELDEAQVKADKLGKKGGKANSVKVDNASQKLDTANSQWDSQAPFVFEKLQAVDETRLNHLRDVLTQYQTHEADRVERNRVTAETTLNSLLEVDTSQEIKNFARNSTQGRPKLEKNARRTSSSAGSNTLPPPPIAKTSIGDGGSEHSGRNEGPSEPKGGLKRFGTMLGRRRQSVHGSFMRAPSPTKGMNSPFGRPPGSRDGRPSPSPRTSSNNLRETPSRDNRLSSLAESPASPTDRAAAAQAEQTRPKDVANGEFTGFRPGSLLNPEVIPPKSAVNTKENINGTALKDVDVSDVKPPPGPPPSHLKENATHSAQNASEGFSVPPPRNDPISQAQQEAANESDQPQFKLDIKKEPIREEDADAQAALSNVANTLRSSTLITPSRKAGTVRGRRDVRNTIYVPAPETTAMDISPSPGHALSGNRAATLSTEHSTSDTQSIRSARSLTSNSVVKHPDMHQPGLNSSIVETVSASFENGELKTGAVIGEIAFAFGPAESSPAASSGTETIRLNNFPALEAIAPNHTFVNELPDDKPGEYSVNVSLLSKTMVAFRYKVHIDESNLAAHAPLFLKPAWKPQGEKLGVVIEYKVNPSFPSTSVVLHNLVLIASYEGARAAGCQTKPTGTHLKEKSLIYWRLGDVTLDGSMQKVVGRLIGAEGGEPKPGLVEARWEMSSSAGQPPGSGLGVSRLESSSAKGKEKVDSSDPFADESGGVGPPPPPGGNGNGNYNNNWVEVESVRKIVSGKYDAKQQVEVVALAATG